MFATLLGAYPTNPAAPTPEEAVRDAMADLDAAGLEPLSDGRGGRGPGAVTVAAWTAAASGSTRAVKASIVGPVSGSQAGNGDANALAEQLHATIDALADAGCLLVDIEEPDIVAIGDDAAAQRALADAHRRLTDGIGDRIHLSLVVTGGSASTSIGEVIFDLPYSSYAFDLIAGPDNWRLIAEAPGDRGIVCGALDPSATSGDRPETLVWAAHYAASTGGRGLARVGLANASSLEGLTVERARTKLRALADAARIAAVESADELATALDPRAVDIRSAALGRYTPSAESRSRGRP